jgi:hypothetical protein
MLYRGDGLPAQFGQLFGVICSLPFEPLKDFEVALRTITLRHVPRVFPYQTVVGLTPSSPASSATLSPERQRISRASREPHLRTFAIFSVLPIDYPF